MWPHQGTKCLPAHLPVSLEPGEPKRRVGNTRRWQRRGSQALLPSCLHPSWLLQSHSCFLPLMFFQILVRKDKTKSLWLTAVRSF